MKPDTAGQVAKKLEVKEMKKRAEELKEKIKDKDIDVSKIKTIDQITDLEEEEKTKNVLLTDEDFKVKESN